MSTAPNVETWLETSDSPDPRHVEYRLVEGTTRVEGDTTYTTRRVVATQHTPEGREKLARVVESMVISEGQFTYRFIKVRVDGQDHYMGVEDFQERITPLFPDAPQEVTDAITELARMVTTLYWPYQVDMLAQFLGIRIFRL